jgi:peptidoglycan/xylan/chitin deacetylase (PgdA/CDA1 family)
MFRLDRLASLYIWGPIARNRIVDQVRVPILMYHSVSDSLFGKSHPYFQINTSPKMFAEQMQYVRDAGYVTVTLEDIAAGRLQDRKGKKLIAITFDDGYRDFYTDAFPVLDRLSLGATMFLTSGRIQNRPERYEGVEYLCWSDVREMHANGIQFGSHTMTHPELRTLSRKEVDREMRCSKEIIEERLGAGVTSFAYPYGFPEEDHRFIRDVREILEGLKYKVAVTTILGTATFECDRFLLPRLPVNSWDDPQFFQTKLEGGYDWLHFPQLLSKKLRKAVSASVGRTVGSSAKKEAPGARDCAN